MQEAVTKGCTHKETATVLEKIMLFVWGGRGAPAVMPEMILDGLQRKHEIYRAHHMLIGVRGHMLKIEHF